MGHTSTFETKFRRRRLGKTNYAKRIALLKSNSPRLVVRTSNKNILCQFIEARREGDKVIASAHSKELKKFGWNAVKSNTPNAYLVGFLAGLKAKKAGAKKAVLDIGLRTPVHGSKVFAALKGAIDSGLSIPAEESAFPSEERIMGKHIQDFSAKLSAEELNKKFGEYLQNKIDPTKLTELFEKTKKEILRKFGEKNE